MPVSGSQAQGEESPPRGGHFSATHESGSARIYAVAAAAEVNVKKPRIENISIYSIVYLFVKKFSFLACGVWGERRHGNNLMLNTRLSLLDLSFDRLSSLFVSLGFPKYRASQVWNATLNHNALSYAALNALSLKEREVLDESFLPLRRASLLTETISRDGTIKWLINVAKGSAEERNQSLPRSLLAKEETISTTAQLLAVETVFIPEKKRASGTLCVSSQSGCSLSCSFCHTGTQALSGSLPASSIIEQVLMAKARLSSLNASRLSHIVFMGQGEPLLNWRAVKTAIETLTHPLGLNLPRRRITVSTSGVAPLISKIATEIPGVRLAISLHAPNDELRSKIMGINKQWPIIEVLKACQEYIDSRLAALLEKKKKTGNELVVDTDDDEEEEEDDNTTSITPLSTKEVHTERYYNNGANRIRVTFEYVLLEGINDSDSTALELAKLLQSQIRNASVYTHVNLIHFNEWPGSSYTRSSEERMTSFQQVLLKNRIISTVRRSRGLDILGACGQLKSSKQLKQVTC